MDIIKTVIFIIFIFSSVIFYTNYVAGIYMIPTSYMQNTLLDGDIIIVKKWKYIPCSDDIVFIEKNNSIPSDMAVRVVAIAGQTVKITEDGIFVDNIRLIEPYLKTKSWEKIITKEIEIEKSFVYVLGDNRNIAVDSRNFGVVSDSDIIGEVIFRIFPPFKNF